MPTLNIQMVLSQVSVITNKNSNNQSIKFKQDDLLYRLHATPGLDSIADLVPQVQTLEGTHHQTSGQVTMSFIIEKLYIVKARPHYTIK